jgi:hypothetical protein
MKKKNLAILGLMSLAALVIVFASANQASADTTNKQRGYNLSIEDREAMRSERQAEAEARRATMEQVMAQGDYNTWVETVKAEMGEDAPILSKVTADNFQEFVLAHQEMSQAREKMSQFMPGERGFGKHAGDRVNRGMRGSCPLAE